MNYQYVSARVKAKGDNQRWKEINALNMTIESLLNANRFVFLRLSNPALVDQINFDLVANRNLVANQTLTVAQWLVANGNATLPGTTGTQTVRYTHCNYSHALLANYHVRRVPPVGHPDIDIAIEEKTDALLTRQGTDYLLLQRRSLVSINGAYHRTEGSVHGLYIRDAVKSLRAANDNNIGILSFANVADLKQVSITPDMIYKQLPEQELWRGAYIDIGEDIENKTVLLVLGGYLHVVDGTYKVVGPQQLHINLAPYQMAHRYYEMRKHINVDQLRPHFNPGPADSINVANLRSDQFVIDFLTLKQSFVVIVDTPSLVTNEIPLQPAKVPGLYTCHMEPKHLMYSQARKPMDYWTRKEGPSYVINCGNALDTRYRFETTQWENDVAIDDRAETVNGIRYSQAYLLEIGKEELVTT